MKKILSALLFAIAIVGYAQDSKVRFGIQGGLSLSGFYGYSVSPSTDFSLGFNYLGGLSVELPIEKRWSLKIELNYEPKGNKEVDDLSNEFVVNTTTRKWKYDYLVLPVFVKYKFRDDNSFYLNAGPFIGYLLKSKVTGEWKVDDESHPFNIDTTNDNMKTDFGLSVGFGKNFDLNKKSTLYSEFRVNIGLVDTSKEEEFVGGVKTNSLNLLVGYSFN